MLNDLLILLALLIILVEPYRKVRQIWLQCCSRSRKNASLLRKPPMLRLKSERHSQAELIGRVNTYFVERLNLTIRQCVTKLTRRTWGPARYTTELMEHL